MRDEHKELMELIDTFVANAELKRDNNLKRWRDWALKLEQNAVNMDEAFKDFKRARRETQETASILRTQLTDALNRLQKNCCKSDSYS